MSLQIYIWSSGWSVNLAVVWRIAVTYAIGLKKPEIQMETGTVLDGHPLPAVQAANCSWRLIMSSNHDPRPFREGYPPLVQVAGTCWMNRALSRASMRSDILRAPCRPSFSSARDLLISLVSLFIRSTSWSTTHT